MDVDMIVEVIPVLPDMIKIFITVFFLFLLLTKLLYNPINEFIDERKEKVRTDLDSAKLSRQEAESLKLEYESRIADAREESQKILADARSRGEELKQEILQDAQNEASSIKERALKDIEREKAAAFQAVKSETGNMALLIASKIMEQEMNHANQEELVDKFIEEVGNRPWQN